MGHSRRDFLENSLLNDPLLALEPSYASRTGTLLRPKTCEEVFTMQDRLLRRREVEEITGLSRASIYRQMDEGKFPPRVKVSATAVRWRQSEVYAWIQSRPEA